MGEAVVHGTAVPDEIELGRVRVLVGPDRGRYPNGNSLLVVGERETLLVDPSLPLATPDRELPRVDRVVLSHVHEDHFAGLARFPDRPVHVPSADRLGLVSLEGLLTIYGMPPDVEEAWVPVLQDEFHYRPRPDALGFDDGHEWDLGGVVVRAVHLPGHTRGHSGFLVEPDGVCYLGDIDLTGFGPYYGDAWSSLEDWAHSLERCRRIEARWYATFHQKLVVEGRERFLDLLDVYEAVIGRREVALLEHLAEPRTTAEIVAHRFVYRPGVELPWVDYVEERSMTQHLERLRRQGRVREVEPGRFRAT